MMKLYTRFDEMPRVAQILNVRLDRVWTWNTFLFLFDGNGMQRIHRTFEIRRSVLIYSGFDCCDRKRRYFD
jgi:hypothetical protein